MATACNVIRRGSRFKYLGAASNINNQFVRLCNGINTAGKYIMANDIAPNFSLYFDVLCPTWSTNGFKLGVHSDFQSFYYQCPSSNQLQMTDMNGTPLKSWTIGNSNRLNNGAWNSWKLVNDQENLILSINDFAYFAKVPNWPAAGKFWKNGTFTWTGSNSATQTGSNCVRRLYAQGHTHLNDPVHCHNALTAQTVSTSKVGCTEMRSRISDTNCIFNTSLYSSNAWIKSNCMTSNLVAQNAVANNFIGSNISTSNLNVTSLTTNGLTVNGISAFNINTTHAFSLLNSNLPNNTGEVAFPIGKFKNTRNAANIRYRHIADGSTSNYLGIGFWGADDALNVTGGRFVGINTTNPSTNLEVSGNARVTGVLQAQTAQFNNIAASNLGALAFSNSIGYGNLTGNPASINTGAITCTSLLSTGSGTFTMGNQLNSWANAQLLFGYAGTQTYRHSVVTRHNAGAVTGNAIDFRIWENSINLNTVATKNVMTVQANGVGILNTNPTRPLDVTGDAAVSGNLRVTQLSTDTIYSNGGPDPNGFIIGQVEFKCQTVDTQKINNHNGIEIWGNKTIQLGGLGGWVKDSEAGKIGYGTYTTSPLVGLDIVGAGPNAYDRLIKLWDYVVVQDKFKITDSGTPITGYHTIAFINITSTTRSSILTWTHNLNKTGGHVWATLRDEGSPAVDDVFVFKLTSQTNNSIVGRLVRVDTNAGWTRGITLNLHWLLTP